MTTEKSKVSYEDISSDDFDKLLQELDTSSSSTPQEAPVTEAPQQPVPEASAEVSSECSSDTAPTPATATTATASDDVADFAWPEQFRSSQYQTQADMFRQWWQNDRTDAQLLLSLLLTFNSAPLYAGSDFICMLLREISRCLVTCQENNGASPKETAAVLEPWASMLKNGKHDIQLRIPAIGSHVETAWMHSESNAATVEAIYTWAVYSSGGIVYAAEIQ